jgi:hypothetical protein
VNDEELRRAGADLSAFDVVEACLNPRTVRIALPFITGVGLYFIFGLASFWWVQQERLPLPLPQMLFGLLVGDVFFLGLIVFAGGGFSAPLPILLFPQLAAAGWLLRQETAFVQAGFASIALLGLTRSVLPTRRAPGVIPDRDHRLFGYSRPSASPSPSADTRSNRDLLRSAASMSQTPSREPAHHPGHAGFMCWSST